jgi:hypothetical protein
VFLFSSLTSNYYSIFYNNSEVWHIPSLHTSQKSPLLSASAADSRSSDVLRPTPSYHGRATTVKLMGYKLSLQLCENFNDSQQNETWLHLNFQLMFNSRCDTISIADDSSRNKVGRNRMINRMNVSSGKIKYD